MKLGYKYLVYYLQIQQTHHYLLKKTFWLILAKLFCSLELHQLKSQIKIEFPNIENIFEISTVAKTGLKTLSQKIMAELEVIWTQEKEDPDAFATEQATQRLMQEQGREKIIQLAEQHKMARLKGKSAKDDGNDDGDVDVEYVSE